MFLKNKVRMIKNKPSSKIYLALSRLFFTIVVSATSKNQKIHPHCCVYLNLMWSYSQRGYNKGVTKKKRKYKNRNVLRLNANLEKPL